MTELRIGIAGLGTAARQIIPYFPKAEGVRLAGAADIRAGAREKFAAAHKLPAFDSVEALCRSEIDAVWIETPNHLHCEHALTAFEAGKHVIVAKPMAAALAECDRMIDAARVNNLRLLIGHSKIFDPPIKAIADIARAGTLGKVIQIDSWLFNDWLRRPRLPEELDENRGAGFILRQAPHIVDIVNSIAGSRANWVRAVTGRWEPNIACDGNVSALIGYESGAVANISLNGYGYFDTSELTGGIGTFGNISEKTNPVIRPAGPLSENEKYIVERDTTPGESQPFFGLHVVSFERGVVRQAPNGLFLYTDEGREEISLPSYQGRAAELIELRDALKEGRDVFPNGAWGKANLEMCLGLIRSSREGKDVALGTQV